MVYFQTKNTDVGKFGRAVEWKRLVPSKVIWNILWRFGIFLANFYILWPFGNLVAIWYIFPVLGT
jgi:hypothetical protein